MKLAGRRDSESKGKRPVYTNAKKREQATTGEFSMLGGETVNRKVSFQCVEQETTSELYVVSHV